MPGLQWVPGIQVQVFMIEWEKICLLSLLLSPFPYCCLYKPHKLIFQIQTLQTIE